MTRRALACLLLILSAPACHDRREPDPPELTYEGVASTITRACVPCHPSADSPLDLTGYLQTIACNAAGARLTEPPDERAPLYAVLARPDHADKLTESERAELLTWIRGGSKGTPGIVHPGGILDFRGDEWHGKLAARDQFIGLREPESDLSCGRCHAGAPVQPSSVHSALPGAPPCTDCHTEEGGALACPTCHGDDERAFPPRDPCLFPGGSDGGLHAPHLGSSAFRAGPLPCSACHPAPGAGVMGGTHGDGTLQVQFDPVLAGADARITPDGTCQNACHARGGSVPMPSWHTALTLDCNSCHQSPPPSHYAGACSSCHREMGASPISLMPGPLHVDGKVELGVSSESCGACHGSGTDPWPVDPSHYVHRDSTLTKTVACDECHQVPPSRDAPGHMDGVVTMRFGGRALGAVTSPTYDPATKTCAGIACHGAALTSAKEATPAWGGAVSAPASCVTCHGTPPPPPHVQQPTCEGSLCHGGAVKLGSPGLSLTEAGRAQHIDGTVQAGSLTAARASSAPPASAP